MISTGQFSSVLAVVQQRLIPSKLNDAWGFELLHSVVQYVPLYVWAKLCLGFKLTLSFAEEPNWTNISKS